VLERTRQITTVRVIMRNELEHEKWGSLAGGEERTPGNLHSLKLLAPGNQMTSLDSWEKRRLIHVRWELVTSCPVRCGLATGLARGVLHAPQRWPLLLYMALDAPVTHVVPRVRGRRVGTRSGSGLVPREVGCRRGARLLLVLEALPLAPAEEAHAAAPAAGGWRGVGHRG
jgi:hypothetical protein